MAISTGWIAAAALSLVLAGCSSGEDEGNDDGTSAAVCVAAGACDAESCAAGECFDAERCATQQTACWGTEWHDYAKKVALTASDERVIVGSTTLGDATDADRDLFVTKLSAAGDVIWTRQLGTPASDGGAAVAVDASDSIYVVGSSAGQFDGHASTGGSDVLVLKLAADGSTLWSLLFGSAGGDYGDDIALDALGNVFVAGTWNYNGTAATEQPFMGRVSGDGELLSAGPLSIARGSAASIDVDAQGNAFVTGEKLPPDSGKGDIFAQKLDSDGSEIWSLEWASDADDWTNGAVLDGRGQLYVVGTTAGALEGNPAPKSGNWSLFLSLVDAHGQLSWTRTYYPDVDTRGGDVALARNGDLLVAGSVLGEFTLNDVALGVDAFAIRACPDGSPKAIQRRDLGSDEWTWGATEAKDGSVLLTGYSFQAVASASVDTYLIDIRPE